MIDILFPAGRLVGGSLYIGQTKNDKGEPLVFKSGKNAGQPRTQYSFGVAFPKAGTAHWKETEWGAKIYAEGQKTAEKFYQGRFFAWKITDGDSTEPNKKGNKPCDREGYPGNWVIWFSGNFAPNLFNANGTERLTTPDLIKAGHWVQVLGETEFNKNTESPGMYQNFKMVAHSGYGEEIVLKADVDASSVGFGAGALPPGASATPVAGMSDQAPPPAAPAPQAASPTPPPPPHTSYMGETAPPPPPAPAAAFPPAGWWPHPQAPGSFYNAQNEVLTEAQLRARG